MSLIEIFFLAFALSIDACIVSFSYGLNIEKHKRLNSFLLATFTGFFQFLMPILGYFLANLLHSYIEAFSNIIVFIIFTYLGVRFIKESFENKPQKPSCLSIKCLFLIAIATSIDAFSSGIPLLLCNNKILIPSILIGIITFINALFGFWCGFILKKLPTKHFEILGGIILICLGIKTLL